MGTWGMFVAGLSAGIVAGGASCAAVQGGLLAGAIGRRRAARQVAPTPVGVPGGLGRVAADAAGAQPDLVRAGESALLALGAFLGAKLVSHTLLGALLGTVGAAAQPGPRARAVMLLAAAAIMVIFALDLIGVRGMRRLVPRPPASWARRVRRSTRSTAVSTPAVLGFLTVLLPCGVTLSMALLAITSSSALAGAAVMAGFVIGTAPLFAAIGFLVRQSTQVAQGRLSIVTGLVVLTVAAFTFTAGLRLGGWTPGEGSGISLAPVSADVAAASAQAVRSGPDGTQVITLTVAKSAYRPDAVAARAGVPTHLVLTTKGIAGCTSAFVIPARGLQKVLPKTGLTSIDLGSPAPGTLRYVCGAGMYGGQIEFRPAVAAGAGR
jgi:uncharacterized protein